jgi:2-polyprenyl-3-methyl-5-hydroxy-6-metoxy-1,4-benzoquinol methylase
MTAADYGFAAVGVDARAQAVASIQAMGFNAMQQDFMPLTVEIVPDVLSMMDVLAHLPSPRDALRKAAQLLRPGGVLVVSFIDFLSSSWRAMEMTQTNPHWVDLERHHIFGRERVLAMLSDAGFEPADVSISGRRGGELEVCALRR